VPKSTTASVHLSIGGKESPNQQFPTSILSFSVLVTVVTRLIVTREEKQDTVTINGHFPIHPQPAIKLHAMQDGKNLIITPRHS
jgi:hypothetical protein